MKLSRFLNVLMISMMAAFVLVDCAPIPVTTYNWLSNSGS